MKRGRTIAARREKPERESERMAARKRARTKLGLRWLVVVAVVAGVGFLVVRGGVMLMDAMNAGKLSAVEEEVRAKAEIIDETEAGITKSMREYVAHIEADLAEYGYKVTRAVLPVGRMRQVNIYIEGLPGYIKTRTDRGTGVQAEDVDRMVRHLGGADFEYIDVRVERKAYWK